MDMDTSWSDIIDIQISWICIFGEYKFLEKLYFLENNTFEALPQRCNAFEALALQVSLRHFLIYLVNKKHSGQVCTGFGQKFMTLSG